MPKLDHRSPEADSYRKLYKTAAWQRTRLTQLRKEPLCQRCKAKGLTVSATVVHHKKAHKGNLVLFMSPSNLESVCAPCHDSDIQSEEALGYSNEVDPSTGYPVDPRHPFNATA